MLASPSPFWGMEPFGSLTTIQPLGTGQGCAPPLSQPVVTSLLMPPPLRALVLALALAGFLAGPVVRVDPPEPRRGAVNGVTARIDYFRWPSRTPERRKPTLGQRAASLALKAVGVPYRWGGSSPASGFDCSGLVHWAYGRLGVEVPHSSYALYDLGRSVRRSALKAGDLLFFYGLGHVGLYVGRGRMVHAPQSGRTVEVVSLAGSNYGGRLVGARRLVS
jgi:hypothetical protein